MKFLYKISGKISLLLYILFLWQLWLLCRFGGVRQRLPVLALCGLAGRSDLFSYVACGEKKV